MLPLVLIFLFAQSALSLPSRNVNFYDISNAPGVPDNGQLINSNVTTSVMELFDGGDTNLYTQILIVAVHDLASSNDISSQAAAAIQTICITGELGNGIPGDACPAADLVNAIGSNRSGSAVVNFIQRINAYIDIIVGLVVNPNAVRYSAGPRGNCLGGGRTYEFERAWDAILATCNYNQFALFNEEYCAAKRLYTAFNVRSNNIAAAVTAASTPEVNQVAVQAIVPVANFLRSVAAGENPVQAAQVAKNALMGACL